MRRGAVLHYKKVGELYQKRSTKLDIYMDDSKKLRFLIRIQALTT